ncbi:hypothetical protein Tco_0710126 [Tanacetum coccineum]
MVLVAQLCWLHLALHLHDSAWLHDCFTDCRCVWLPDYRCVCLPGYTSALQIADVFGSAWFRMILPGYTSDLQIADVFGCLVTRLLYRLQMCLVSVLLWHAGISAKKEAPVNFLTGPSDGRSTLRPVDVLVFGWVGRKHARVDLTGVSSLVGLSSRGFTAGQAALKAASGKVTKHKKACIENQHVFILFAFDTFGFLAPEAMELLSRVQRVMHSNIMTPRSTDVVFKRIGFAIQKRLAAQLVSRLSSTTM